MALDEKTFQSAIAKINKVKARSASVAQVLVFEDPPHMRKQNDEEPALSNPILEQADKKKITIPEVEKIASKSYEIQPDNKGTNKGTDHGTKWGTEITPRTNVVQKEGTNSNTQIATKKGTQKGFTTHKRTNNKISSDMDFLYRRPYDALTGIPKKIVDVIFEICRKYSMHETPPVPFATLVRLCKEKKNSVKVARQRLLEEGIISTKNSQDTPARGRSGMLIYKLRDDLFQEIDDSLSLFVRKDDFDKKGTKYSTDRGTSFSSSSNSNITTITDLPNDWKKIDCSNLREINFGMVELLNIYKKRPEHITAAIVQDSINQFSFGLSNNKDRYKNMKAPSGILVAQLIQGNPWTEAAYVSIEEINRIEKEKKVTAFLESQFKEPKFIEWFNQLTDEDRDNIVPKGVRDSSAYMISKIQIQKEHMKIYFERTIWPNILAELKLNF